jgi:tetratricopeptide (TPR) repeat protein
MQTVLYLVGEFAAHEWRFLVLLPIFALLAYIWAVVVTPRRALEWAVKLWPLSARLHLELGRTLDRIEPETAEAALKHAILLNPAMQQPYYHLANLQLDQKERLDDAEQTVKQILRRFPGDPVGWCLQGLVRERRGCYAEAEKAYRTANAAAPDFAWPCVLLGALLRDKLDNPLGAEIAYRQAVRNEPGNASHYFHLGNLMFQARRFGEAVKCYEMATRKDRSDPASLVNLGLALVAARRAAEARKLLPRILRMQPKSARTELSLGRLLRQLKQPVKAEAAFRRAIDKDLHLMDAYSELGRLLDERPECMPEAEQVYRQGLQLDPTDAQLSYDLSLLLRRTGRENEAIPLLEQIVAEDPDDADAYLALAAIHRLCGGNLAWQDYAARARRAAPPDEPYLLACIEAVCDNRDRAFELLTKAAKEAGFSRWWAWEDPDLQFLRDDPRFAEIVGARPEGDTQLMLA